MKTGIIKTRNDSTFAWLIIEETKEEIEFKKGVFGCVEYAKKHGINLKYHINNHPGPTQ